MILKSLNGNKLSKYGYSDEFEYFNPTFHGHQIGISIGVTSTKTQEIVKNHISEKQGTEEERNKIFLSIMNDPNIIKLEKEITQFEDNHFVARTIWLLPYAVQGHTAFRETLNFDNIVCASNASNHVVLELLFVEDALNRYMTVSYDTANVSIMDFIREVFECGEEYPEELNQVEYRDDEEEGPGYYLDFYDMAGERFELRFDCLERLRDALVSVRLLEVTTKIEDN